MKVGDLVKITRASIGIPKGTIGLIMKVTGWPETCSGPGRELYHIHFMSNVKVKKNHPRPFLLKDLQIL